MKLKSSIQVLVAAALICCVACNSPYGTSTAKDSGTVKAQGSSNGSDQGGSYRSAGGDNSSGSSGTTASDAPGKDTNKTVIPNNSINRDSVAMDSSSKMHKGKKP